MEENTERIDSVISEDETDEKTDFNRVKLLTKNDLV